MLCNRVSEAVTQTIVSLLASWYPAASTYFYHAKLLLLLGGAALSARQPNSKQRGPSSR